MIYHVSVHGDDRAPGTEEAPFRTVSHAAHIACAGDTVRVHEGTYRECVRPRDGGRSGVVRVVYEAAAGERVRIVGSEIVDGWQKQGDLYAARVDNALFGAFNPFKEELAGDWLHCEPDSENEMLRVKHLGCVYLGGEPLKEATDDASLREPMRWRASVGERETVILANFGERDPARETVEINVRKFCFVPEHCGVDYVTVRGFEFAQAATQWAPPTAEQEGAVWTYWSKGWIIENNIVHDSKCCGISLGKEIGTGQNETLRFAVKPGYQNQLETVFAALNGGWSKERIGSHVVRNNEIYRCGQAGVVGHLGGAFSEICGNDIHHIGAAREFDGDETGGIKLHAALDTYLHDNVISHCVRGLWLDWEAQGVRVSRNVFFANGPYSDLFVEVGHGPCLVDDNVFGSEISLQNVAQGTAFVNNLFAGKLLRRSDLMRSTPYHVAHSTAVRGTALIYGFDDRFYGNIFLGERGGDAALYGTAAYRGCTASLAEFVERARVVGKNTVTGYASVPQPAYVDGNVYFDGAEGFERETNAYHTDASAEFSIGRKGDSIAVSVTVPRGVQPVTVRGTDDLPVPRISDLPYENADGSAVRCDTGVDGVRRGGAALPGPFGGLKHGKNEIVLPVPQAGAAPRK